MRAGLLGLAGLIILAPAARAEDGFSFSTGASVASGTFTTPSRTTIVEAPFSLRYSEGPFRLAATLSYLYVDSIGTVLVGTGPPVAIVSGTPGLERRARDGLGDLRLSASYDLPESLTGLWLVEFTGQVKAPTASFHKGLGTGETDGAISGNISRAFGPVIPFVDVGYRFNGSPRGFDLRDTVNTSVGATYVVRRTFVTLSYDYNEAITRFIPDAHEVFLGVSGPAIGHLTWTAFGTAGLSSGAPDYTAGMTFSFKLGRIGPTHRSAT